jgi:hypothetical protein
MSRQLRKVSTCRFGTSALTRNNPQRHLFLQSQLPIADFDSPLQRILQLRLDRCNHLLLPRPQLRFHRRSFDSFSCRSQFQDGIDLTLSRGKVFLGALEDRNAGLKVLQRDETVCCGSFSGRVPRTSTQEL